MSVLLGLQMRDLEINCLKNKKKVLLCELLGIMMV